MQKISEKSQKNSIQNTTKPMNTIRTFRGGIFRGEVFEGAYAWVLMGFIGPFGATLWLLQNLQACIAHISIV
jgi:hypothetical protein